MEDAVVKTVASFLNSAGATLLIGVNDSGSVLGLHADYARVRPRTGDGFVNWLTTHLIAALGPPGDDDPSQDRGPRQPGTVPC